MFSLEGYQALRRGAGVVRRSDRGLLAVTGPDRLIWLQGLLTNDVASLAIGGVCDAAYLTPQGRMITALRVINLDDRTFLDVPASQAEGLRARLDALIFSEDAQVTDLTPDVEMIDVHGPDAASIHDRIRARFQSMLTAAATDVPFGVPSVSLFVARGDAGTVVSSLTAAGAVETTLETLDVLRVESGTPAFLVDMDEHTIPLEAGIENRALSFTKGCYVGQEVIVRVVQRGHGRVARKLVGLKVPGEHLPRPGDSIVAGERAIGRVTSAVWSPALDCGIALAYVHRDFVEPGTTVALNLADRRLTATVSSLPFVTMESSGSPAKRSHNAGKS